MILRDISSKIKQNPKREGYDHLPKTCLPNVQHGLSMLQQCIVVANQRVTVYCSVILVPLKKTVIIFVQSLNRFLNHVEVHSPDSLPTLTSISAPNKAEDRGGGSFASIYASSQIPRGGLTTFLQKRVRMVATWARVAVPPGFTVPSPMPERSPVPTAQDIASWA